MKKAWQAHLAVDSRGIVYISYPDAGQILAFDKSGTRQEVWTADGAGTKFVRPVGVVVDARHGVLYVMDVGIHKVMKIGLPGDRGSLNSAVLDESRSERIGSR